MSRSRYGQFLSQLVGVFRTSLSNIFVQIRQFARRNKKKYGVPIINLRNATGHSLACQRLDEGFPMQKVKTALGRNDPLTTERESIGCGQGFEPWRRDADPKPFQTYLWERRTLGRPSRQAVCRKVCREGYCHRGRLFLDHRCSHRHCISTFAFLSPLLKDRIAQRT